MAVNYTNLQNVEDDISTNITAQSKYQLRKKIQ